MLSKRRNSCPVECSFCAFTRYTIRRHKEVNLRKYEYDVTHLARVHAGRRLPCMNTTYEEVSPGDRVTLPLQAGPALGGHRIPSTQRSPSQGLLEHDLARQLPSDVVRYRHWRSQQTRRPMRETACNVSIKPHLQQSVQLVLLGLMTQLEGPYQAQRAETAAISHDLHKPDPWGQVCRRLDAHC